MDLCNQSGLSCCLTDWSAILHDKNCNLWHCMQTFRPKSFHTYLAYRHQRCLKLYTTFSVYDLCLGSECLQFSVDQHEIGYCVDQSEVSSQMLGQSRVSESTETKVALYWLQQKNKHCHAFGCLWTSLLSTWCDDCHHWALRFETSMNDLDLHPRCEECEKATKFCDSTANIGHLNIHSSCFSLDLPQAAALINDGLAESLVAACSVLWGWQGEECCHWPVWCVWTGLLQEQPGWCLHGVHNVSHWLCHQFYWIHQLCRL